jgi:hypothetical protein
MSHSIPPVTVAALIPISSQKSKGSSWFEAMADAWGQTLDRQASEIEDIATRISNGDDKPATITDLSAQTLRMGFLSTSAHTAITTAGDALKTMAQKS